MHSERVFFIGSWLLPTSIRFTARQYRDCSQRWKLTLEVTNQCISLEFELNLYPDFLFTRKLSRQFYTFLKPYIPWFSKGNFVNATCFLFHWSLPYYLLTKILNYLLLRYLHKLLWINNFRVHLFWDCYGRWEKKTLKNSFGFLKTQVTLIFGLL